MDLPELVLVAAAVLEVEPAALLECTDLEALQRVVDAVPGNATSLEQAAVLVYEIVRERPFGDDSAGVAIVAAAQVLDLDGHVTTFKLSDRLLGLLDDIAAGTAGIDTVCTFLSVEVSSMFERFTARARNVITFAYEEANARHDAYVGTEHLLLGLLRESEGIGAKVLVQQGVDIAVVRSEIDHRVGAGAGAAGAGRAPFTPRSKKTLELALHEAIRLGHNYIGTEHLALGLLRVDDGLAAQILVDCFSVEIERVRGEIVAVLASGGWKPKTRRSKPFMRPPVTWASPVDPALVARRNRLLGDVQALLDENQRLRDEIAQLRVLLHAHGIEVPGDPPAEAGDQPA